MHGHRDDNKVILHRKQQRGMLNIAPLLNDLSKTFTLWVRAGVQG